MATLQSQINILAANISKLHNQNPVSPDNINLTHDQIQTTFTKNDTTTDIDFVGSTKYDAIIYIGSDGNYVLTKRGGGKKNIYKLQDGDKIQLYITFILKIEGKIIDTEEEIEGLVGAPTFTNYQITHNIITDFNESSTTDILYSNIPQLKTTGSDINFSFKSQNPNHIYIQNLFKWYSDDGYLSLSKTETETDDKYIMSKDTPPKHIATVDITEIHSIHHSALFYDQYQTVTLSDQLKDKLSLPTNPKIKLIFENLKESPQQS